MTIQLEKAIYTKSRDISNDVEKCGFRVSVESKLQINPNHVFYGSMEKNCRKCNGYKPKCPGYII